MEQAWVTTANGLRIVEAGALGATCKTTITFINALKWGINTDQRAAIWIQRIRALSAFREPAGFAWSIEG